jgi:aldehyde dehydrogenase (NAD+)
MVKDILSKQKAFFNTGVTKSVAFRKHQLDILRTLILKYEKELLDALKKDLNKPEFEAYTNEIGFTLESIKTMKSKVKKWSKRRKVKTPIHQFGSKSFIEPVPYGSVLIIGPFNYPFQLLIEPMIGAIAAGNTVILKPSEYTSHTEKLIVKMIAEAFDEEYVAVFTGGREVTTELINSPFDYIFFTGSVPVGRVVMEAAAKNLVPVTLELGGKSPTIVDKTANIKIAAKRIAWGKYINAGQTCIAPDYIYVHEDIEESFKAYLKTYIHEFYGHAKESPDYGRIVSVRHFNRLKSLINHKKVYHGGQTIEEHKFIEPTILHNVTWDDDVMNDEIFGPILPILTYSSLDEVIHAIVSRPRPLALYLFTENKAVEEKVLKHTAFGGGAINDTITHVANPHLPFGGIGASGMGGYHGKHSFETFSHNRSMIKKSTGIDLKLIFPPYGNKVKLAKKFMN